MAIERGNVRAEVLTLGAPGTVSHPARLIPPTLALLGISPLLCLKSTEQKSQYHHSLYGELHWITLIPQLASRNGTSAFVGHSVHMIKIICSGFVISSPISAPMVETFLPAAEFHTAFSEPVAVGLNAAGAFSSTKNYAWTLKGYQTQTSQTTTVCQSTRTSSRALFLQSFINTSTDGSRNFTFQLQVYKRQAAPGNCLTGCGMSEEGHTPQKVPCPCVFLFVLRFVLQ